MDDAKRRMDYFKRLQALKNDRSTWIEHWQDLGQYIKPRAFRYLASDANKGIKRNQNIINNAATRSLRTMAAGMMAGITSPARPWFRLGTKDPEAGESAAARAWLDIAEDRLRKGFAGSNVYKALHNVYEYLGQFGTAVMFLEEDHEDTFRAYVFPIGQYVLANSERGQVDTVYREFQMTVRQLVQKFGLEKCSASVRARFENNGGDSMVKVVHVIEPSAEHEPGKALGKGSKPYASCWFEEVGDAGTGFLREGGFEEFPAMAPRWNTTGEDCYGESPGMDALGDIKALQLLEKRKAQVMDKIVNPPMKGPMSLMNQRVSLLPGDMTYVDSSGAGQSFEPAVVMPPTAMAVAEASIQEHVKRIDSTFFADLWLMLANSEGPQMTAREVAERHEEKMLQLGPVMENLERELLGPLIIRAFFILLRKGVLPPPPKELQGQEFAIEYVSIMAQAQKMLSLSGIERLAGFVGNLVAVKPEAMDKLNTDVMIDEYASALGVKANMTVDQDAVDALRAQRQQAQQQQQQMEQAAQAAKGAQVLSQTDTSGNNALTQLMSQLPQATQGGGQA